jgi:hypothetical protein
VDQNVSWGSFIRGSEQQNAVGLRAENEGHGAEWIFLIDDGVDITRGEGEEQDNWRMT